MSSLKEAEMNEIFLVTAAIILELEKEKEEILKLKIGESQIWKRRVLSNGKLCNAETIQPSNPWNRKV